MWKRGVLDATLNEGHTSQILACEAVQWRSVIADKSRLLVTMQVED
jgi:hypothetical protein